MSLEFAVRILSAAAHARAQIPICQHFSFTRVMHAETSSRGSAAAESNGGASDDAGGAVDMDMVDASDSRASPVPAASTGGSAFPALAALSLHAWLHAQCLSLLGALVRHADALLDGQRKYWLPLVAQLVALLQERAPSSTLTPAQKRERRARRAQAAAAAPSATASFFELAHPAHAAPGALPPPAPAALLPLSTLTHVQRLLTSLMHSHSAKLYSEPVGGAAGVKQLQQALSEITNQTIQRPLHF
jgi:hypothetical protein